VTSTRVAGADRSDGAVSIEQCLARFIANTTIEDVPDSVLQTAKLAIADTVAVIVAGTRSELAPAVFSYLEEEHASGPHPVVGSNLRLPADKAALANATLGHALDYDDVVSAMPGHPSAILLPALMAGHNGAALDGASFVTAYVVGFEVATKMGIAMGNGHYRRGWHATGTLGIFGATAAIASVLGFDQARAAMALGIAASMAAGLRVNFGTMTKPLHSGWAASAGIVAARLAAAGFTSSVTALGGTGGFFDVYGGDMVRAREVMLSGLASPFTMVAPGMSLKKYPCCYAVHRAIDALVSMRAEGRLDASARLLEAIVPPGSLLPLPYQRPRSGFEAKFSMEYTLAAGALGDDFGFETFNDAAVARPEIGELLERTSVREDVACSPDDPRGERASAGTRGLIVVRVVGADGDVTERVVTTPPGSPKRPLGWPDMEAKFFDCAAFGRLDPAVSERTLARIRTIEAQPDVSDLFGSLDASSFDVAPFASVLHDPAHVSSGDEV
jgi:2-methylcitrate dehydratase PrpD